MCTVKFRRNFVTLYRDMILMPESRHNESGVRSQVMDEEGMRKNLVDLYRGMIPMSESA